MFFPVAGDPYYSSVSLLLPMTGANEGTTFTDMSPSPKTITVYGNAKTVTAVSKWGSSSGYFDGQDSPSTYLSAPDSTDWHFTGAYSIEVWLYVIAYKAVNFWIFQQSDGLGGRCPIRVDLLATGILNCSASSDNINWVYSTDFQSTTALATGQWYHVALCDDATTCRLFVNGTVEASKPTWAKTNSTYPFLIGGGYSGGDREFYGYLQDFRITTGIARYTNNFTPPDGPLPSRTLESPVHRRTVQQPSHHNIARLGL